MTANQPGSPPRGVRFPPESPSEEAIAPAANDAPARRFRVPPWLAAILLALFLAGGWIGSRFLDLNAWFDERAKSLAPLDVALIAKGKVVSAEMKSTTAAGAPEGLYSTLDAMIAGTQLKGREGFVSHLSRDTPRRDPLFRGWWVTVFLKTDVAEGSGPPRATTFALRYAESAEGFRLLETKTLGIP